MTIWMLTSRSGEALRTESETFKNSGITLNGKQVQLKIPMFYKNDSEFYSSIRFKSNARKGESHLLKLKTQGVSYIEIRSVDLNRLIKVGVHPEQLLFLPPVFALLSF